MTISGIYDWLIENDPTNEDSEIRKIWTNMASYCYFMNVVDFDNLHQDQLKEILDKGLKYNISIPDKNHEEVISLVEYVKRDEIDTYLNKKLTQTT